MAAAATVGLMLWDGQSRGTLMNVLRLAERGKIGMVKDTGLGELGKSARFQGETGVAAENGELNDKTIEDLPHIRDCRTGYLPAGTGHSEITGSSSR